MAFITAGYDGTVDEVQFAEVLYRYSVVGADDFKATTQAGDRIVAIANGVALGPGTRDVATAIPNIQFAAATGTRWDLVALRRDWQPPGGASSIVIIQGGSSKGYPVVGTAATNWNRRPGIMDDQPLYLQEVNGTLLGQRIDVRAWFAHGGMVAASEDAKPYLERVGAEVLIGNAVWRYVPGSNGVASWVVDTPVPVAYSFIDNQPNYNFQGTANVTTLRDGRKRVDVDLTMVRVNASNSVSPTRQDMGVVLPSAAVGAGNTKILACPFSITTGLVFVQIRPSTGVLSFWSQSALTWAENDFVSLNFSYYI